MSASDPPPTPDRTPPGGPADDAPAGAVPPRVVVVMGVSGSGKSTVAALLAERLGWMFVDGDSFHTPEHIAKMHAGQALDDEDRAPWLARIAVWIGHRLERGEPGVIVCSALRRAYRAALTRGHPGVRLVYLRGSPELIAARLAARHGHFMPARLLDTQFAVLEPPGPDERPVTVGIDAAPERIVDAILRALTGDGGPRAPVGEGVA